jgi:galactofuranosylgalactofuranosylrhamnosyl-N-acetylglucosaminyl-diphospho-decaprenol beta-1,5/1,6-galactofuranosyltransferase
MPPPVDQSENFGLQHSRESAGERTRETLQHFIFGDELLEPALYYTARSRAGVPLGRLPADRAGLHIPPRAEVSFASLLNAFFERNWVEHTKLRRIACVIETSGAATLTLHRAGNDPFPLESRAVSGARVVTTFNIDLDAPTRRHLGYLYLTITDVGADFTLHAGEWVTHQPPERTVDLEIVFCTFNKVPFIRRNLQALALIHKAIPEIRRIHVVDQGTDRVNAAIVAEPSLNALRHTGMLRIVEQENLGGSGGFTRGIMEALASEHTSHVLLLDDDIVLEPRVLQRLIALLAYTRENAMIGGHMLDLYRPAQAAACAETFDFENGGCQRLPPFDFDCRQPENLARMCEIPRASYNAWWFCCFPRGVFERHGLPLPFFIRTDDAEFGVRATRAGEKLIQMPGIFVWHKPFDAKQIAWMSYYSLRNDLILCNIAAPEARRLGKRYRHHFWNAIKAYRYDEALATCLAIEDYLLGPEKLFSDITVRHGALLAMLDPFTARTMDAEFGRVAELDPQEKLHPRLPGFIKNTLSLFWSVIHGFADNKHFAPGSAKVIHQEYLSWPWTYGERGVIVKDPHEAVYRLYRRDSHMAWRLAKRFLRAMTQWRRNDARLRKAYADAAPIFSTWESWETVLGREIPRTPQKDAA